MNDRSDDQHPCLNCECEGCPGCANPHDWHIDDPDIYCQRQDTP